MYLTLSHTGTKRYIVKLEIIYYILDLIVSATTKESIPKTIN